MSEYEELRQLAIEADQRGDTETASAAMDRMELLSQQDMQAEPQDTPFQKGVVRLAPVLDGQTQRITPEGRPIYQTPEGEYVTERTATITDPRINDGKPTNIPTVFNGQIVAEDQAIEIIARSNGVDPVTGRKLEGFNSIDEAVSSAQQRSELLGQQLTSQPMSDIGQAILDIPGGAAISEFASAVNRGAINLLDFLGPEQINNALQLMGSESRVPTLKEQPIIQEATTGEFMEPGLAKEAVRTAGEFVAPVGVGGQVLRTAAAQIPKVAPVAQTVTQRVIQASAGAPGQELTGAVLAGAGSEIGAEVGEALGGKEGKQIGRLIGSVGLPIAETLVKESGKLLATKGAKALLSESAPTIDGLKTAARKVYDDIDSLGVTINSGSVTRLSKQLTELTKKQGFNATIHPKVNAALREFENAAGSSQSLSEIDTLRRIAKAASGSIEPDEARLGRLMTDEIDDFLDNLTKANFSSAYKKDVGAKYKDARQLWRRAKKAEIIEDAFNRARLQATGFENGIRVQFRSILNNKEKARGFTKEELDAMRGVVKGDSLQNMAKMIGRFGFSEGQASNMLMGSLGIAGGAAVGGPAGAVAVPLIGNVSRTLAQKLTRKGAEGADLIVRAGKDGLAIAKAYQKLTKPDQRSPQELAELLLRPDVSLESLKAAIKTMPPARKKLINDAVFLTTAIKSEED